MNEKVYLFSLYERIWHWLQAMVMVLLVLSGLAIHLPEFLGRLPYLQLVRLHNLLAVVLVANALFALIYHLATGKIRQFLPREENYLGLVVMVAIYYLRGIFRGERAPYTRDPEHKLNPLQRLAYLGVLNFLLPFQVATGFLLWAAQRWPAAVDSLLPLSLLGMAHTLGSWLFITFLIAHVYMTTTGPTPTSYLRTMITGWEERH